MTATPLTSHSNSAGFTLVEMLMAMLIMTVGLLGLLQSVNVAYQQSLRDRVRNEAVLLAEEQMHDWRRLAFGDISGNEKTVVKLVGGVPTLFTVTRSVEEAGAGPSLFKPTKKLTVAVQWQIKREASSHEIYTLKNR